MMQPDLYIAAVDLEGTLSVDRPISNSRTRKNRFNCNVCIMALPHCKNDKGILGVQNSEMRNLVRI